MPAALGLVHLVVGLVLLPDHPVPGSFTLAAGVVIGLGYHRVAWELAWLSVGLAWVSSGLRPWSPWRAVGQRWAGWIVASLAVLTLLLALRMTIRSRRRRSGRWFPSVSIRTLLALVLMVTLGLWWGVDPVVRARTYLSIGMRDHARRYLLDVPRNRLGFELRCRMLLGEEALHEYPELLRIPEAFPVHRQGEGCCNPTEVIRVANALRRKGWTGAREVLLACNDLGLSREACALAQLLRRPITEDPPVHLANLPLITLGNPAALPHLPWVIHEGIPFNLHMNYADGCWLTRQFHEALWREDRSLQDSTPLVPADDPLAAAERMLTSEWWTARLRSARAGPGVRQWEDRSIRRQALAAVAEIYPQGQIGVLDDDAWRRHLQAVQALRPRWDPVTERYTIEAK
jgi:hypothetical protein